MDKGECKPLFPKVFEGSPDMIDFILVDDQKAVVRFIKWDYIDFVILLIVLLEVLFH